MLTMDGFHLEGRRSFVALALVCFSFLFFFNCHCLILILFLLVVNAGVTPLKAQREKENHFMKLK